MTDATRALVKKVLGDPSLYPPEFKSWIPKHVEATPTIRFEPYQVKLAPNPGVGKVLTIDPNLQNAWITPGTVDPTTLAGYEVAFNSFISDVTLVATTEGGATTIVTAPAFTADGTSAYMIDFFSPNVKHIGGNRGTFVLYEDGSSIGLLGGDMGLLGAVTDDFRAPARLSLRRIPASGSRTYSVRGFSTNANQSIVQAGAGGSGARVPGFIRITKAT